MTALGTQNHRLAREALAGRPLPAEDDPLPKPPGWFVSRLILAESGTTTVRNQLVAERQSEMIESQVMRLAAGRQFEDSLNGLLSPEVRMNFALLDTMLTNHFRVLQEMGVEPKHGSMAPTGTPAAESGSDMKLAIKRIVELPKEEFLPLLHEMYRKEYELHRYKAEAAPSAVPRVIEGQGRRVEPAG